MDTINDMLRSTPSPIAFDVEDLAACIRACLECTQACTACADACLGEEMLAHLRRCITSDLNCADICAATAKVLSRQTEYDPAITAAALRACRDACSACAAECDKHASMHEHCRVCAEACRRCAQSCDRLLGS